MIGGGGGPGGGGPAVAAGPPPPGPLAPDDIMPNEEMWKWMGWLQTPHHFQVPDEPTTTRDFLQLCMVAKNVARWRETCVHRLGGTAAEALVNFPTRIDAVNALIAGSPNHFR